MFAKYSHGLLVITFVVYLITNAYIVHIHDPRTSSLSYIIEPSKPRPHIKRRRASSKEEEGPPQQQRKRRPTFDKSLPQYEGNHTQANDLSQRNKTKIVGFITGSYAKIAMRWYDRLEILGYNNHAIVCTDQEAYQYFQEQRSHYRVEASYLPQDPDPNIEGLKYGKKMRRRVMMLFAHRWRYLLQSLNEGHHVLITDVDNIWNSYYDMEELELSEYDVYHALETKHPSEVYDDQGFVFCGGMGWFRASPQTKTFIQSMVSQCGVICDDQVLLNQIVAYQLNMEWHRTADHHNTTTSVSSNQDFDSPFENHFSRIEGLVTNGFTGYSRVTGHKSKVWDRDFAYRGENNPETCPPNNWVSMPFVIMAWRNQGPSHKLSSYDMWDRTCPSQYTNSTEGKKKDLIYYRRINDKK